MNNNIQQMIDQAVEKEFTEPKLTGTQFECIDINGELFVADAEKLNTGTLILIEDWEAFRILETPEQKPWITYFGGTYTHLQFAKVMREECVKPRIIHEGL